MRASLLSVATLPLAAQALEFRDESLLVEQPGLIRFPVSTSQLPAGRALQGRQNEVAVQNQMTGFIYTIDLVLGTPGQKVSLQLDTGSWLLWVNPECSTAPDPAFCQTTGRFTQSTTLVDAGASSSQAYGLGHVDFKFGYDYVTVGSSRISQQIFGVATDSSDISAGIMGVAPDAVKGWTSPYPLVIDSLAKQGFINSRAFSMDLHPVSDERGSVIFGGIDTKKFSGQLQKLPFVPAAQSPDGFTRYWVNVDGISITTGDGTAHTVFEKTNGLTAFLDSGTTLTMLPRTMFNEVLKTFPLARKDPKYEQYLVDCSLVNSAGFVSFKFGNTVIKAAFRDFIWQQPQHNVCVLGFAPDDGNQFILGDTFLRSAYVVFDWDNKNAHVAQGQDCGSNLVAIGKGANAVPDIVGDCGRPTPTSTSTSSSTPTPTSIKTSSQSSTDTTTTPKSTATSSTFSESVTSSSHEPSSTHGSSTTQESSSTHAATSTNGSTSTHEASSTQGASSTDKISSSQGLSSTRGSGSITTGWHNATTSASSDTSAPTTYTSVYTTTRTYTITSCAPTVTNCPVGHVTTETIELYTTWCPGETGAPQSTDSQATTSSYQETTAIYTLPLPTCTKPGCAPVTQTAPAVVTVVPIVTQTTTIQVPGCHSCGSAQTVTTITTPAVTYPITTPVGGGPGLSTITKPCSTCAAATQPSPVTAGAARVLRASGAGAIAAVLALAVL